MTFRPRRRLLGFVLAAALVYGLATNTEVVWLYLVASALLGLVPIGLVGPLLGTRRLRLRVVAMERRGFSAPLAQDRGRVFAADTVRLRIESSRHPATFHLASLVTDAGEGAVSTDVSAAGELLVDLAAGRRGRQRITAARVESSWPLGFATVRRQVEVNWGYVVHPPYWLPSRKDRTGLLVGPDESLRRGPGMQFLGLREYRAGDQRRQIHWPTTARLGSLMVVETEAETESRLDFDIAVAGDATDAAADLAGSITASLLAGAVAAGLPFRLRSPGVLGNLTRWHEALVHLATMDKAKAPSSSAPAPRQSRPGAPR